MPTVSKAVLFLLCMMQFYCFVFSSFGMPKSYNRSDRPNGQFGESDDVNFDMFIYKVGPIEESFMRLTVDVYFRQYWRDERLIELYDILSTGADSNTTSIQLGVDYIDQIWVPDIFWVDALKVEKPGVLSKSQSLQLHSNGNIFYSSRLLLVVRCAMKLKYFPLDLQKCSLCFESYLYPRAYQNMTWKRDRVSLSKEQVTANFYVEPDPLTHLSESDYGIGNVWTRLCVVLDLSRKVEIYVVTMFLPSISLVVLSWVGFWVDKRAIPARSGLSITTILAQITLIIGTANKFPGIADLKMADLYLIVNFFYVFASLIEFAVVSYQSPEKEHKKKATVAPLQVMPPESKSPVKHANSHDHGPEGTLIGANGVFHLTENADDQKSSREKNGTVLAFVNKDKDQRDQCKSRPVSGIQMRALASSSTSLSTSTCTTTDDKTLLTTQEGSMHPCNIPYWSTENADVISKWLFPLSFAVWNFLYFIINYHLAGRF